MKRPAMVIAAVATLAVTPIIACINDRDSDTLEREGKGLPAVQQVLTGRFGRNPPLYYKMRLERVVKEIASQPENFPLYDDAAVASDRLGDGEAAIGWMERKRVVLKRAAPTSSTPDKSLREAWYRYYANCGTFWAHRWLHQGTDRSKIGEMKTARAMIARAIEIKPNAHFGREKYQLMAMDWIIRTFGPKNIYDENFLGMPVESYMYRLDSTLKDDIDGDAIEGISGLVALGAAWESFDVFSALQASLAAAGKSTSAEMARRRCLELIENGKTSLNPYAPIGKALAKTISIKPKVRLYTPQELDDIYQRLRDEAEQYQTRCTSYMMERLQQGLHPDTHPDFWNQWHDAGPPPAIPRGCYELPGLQSEASINVTKERICSPRTVSGRRS
jgi:hypothetical protein